MCRAISPFDVYILKSGEPTPKNNKGGKAPGQCAIRTQGEPASATASAPRKPNHAQHKSAERLKKFIEKKKAGANNGQAGEAPAQPTPAAPEPAPVEPDERMADAAPVSVAEEQRGQKRPADETSAPRPQSSPLLSQLQGYAGQRVGSPVEPTEACHTGLRPLGLAGIRRANARDALEARREGALQG